MRQPPKLLLLTLVAMLTLSFAFAATANAKMVKKVDNFILFLDHSGSMGQAHAQTGKTKIDMALEVLGSMNKAVPDLGYKSAFFTFAPFKEQVKPGMYNKTAMSNAIGGVDTKFDIFGRRTPMGDDQANISPMVGDMMGKTALIMVTDGQSNIGSDPVMAAKEMRDVRTASGCRLRDRWSRCDRQPRRRRRSLLPESSWPVPERASFHQ